MSADLTLRVLDIPGLQRRCVPVYESGVSGIEGCRGLLAPRVSNSAECVVRWEDRAAGMETGITGGTAVDMTHPFGRYHALLWLRERGHDLRWAEDEPEVLAWSVLSVSRGGGAIFGVLAPWEPTRLVGPNGEGEYVQRVRQKGGRGADYRVVSIGQCGWHVSATRRGDGASWPVQYVVGDETGPAALIAADRAALAAGYALRNDDGTLTLPELPEVTRG